MSGASSRRRGWRRRAGGGAVLAGVGGLVLVATVLTQPAPAQGGGLPVVYAAVQVNTDINPTRAHNEPQVAVHPDDPDTIVVVAAETNGGTCQVHVSFNAGRSWVTREARPVPAEFGSCYRPTFGLYLTARFASDGTLYVLAMGSNDSGRGATHPYVGISRDLGETWDFTVIARGREIQWTKDDGSTVSDVERYTMARLAVHPTDPMRLYAALRYQPAFTSPNDVPVRSVVATSGDGGRTWSEPVDVFADTWSRQEMFGSDLLALVVDRKGTVYGFTKERPRPSPGTERLLMAKSTDDGRTWTGRVADDSVAVCRFCLTVPEAAIDLRSGAIYVVFDLSEVPPSGAEGDRGNHNRDIWLITSSDGGETWSARMRLNDDRPVTDPPSNQRWPGVAVAPDGRVDVAWHDMRLDPVYNPASKGTYFGQDERHWDVFHTFSTDGGATWSPNIRVSDRTMNKDEGYTMNFNYDQSGPISLVAAAGVTHVAWADSRRGSAAVPTEDVYFTSLLRAEPDDGGFSRPAVFSLGAAAALLVGGLALLVVSLVTRARE